MRGFGCDYELFVVCVLAFLLGIVGWSCACMHDLYFVGRVFGFMIWLLHACVRCFVLVLLEFGLVLALELLVLLIWFGGVDWLNLLGDRIIGWLFFGYDVYWFIHLFGICFRLMVFAVIGC